MRRALLAAVVFATTLVATLAVETVTAPPAAAAPVSARLEAETGGAAVGWQRTTDAAYSGGAYVRAVVYQAPMSVFVTVPFNRRGNVIISGTREPGVTKEGSYRVDGGAWEPFTLDPYSPKTWNVTYGATEMLEAGPHEIQVRSDTLDLALDVDYFTFTHVDIFVDPMNRGVGVPLSGCMLNTTTTSAVCSGTPGPMSGAPVELDDPATTDGGRGWKWTSRAFIHATYTHLVGFIGDDGVASPSGSIGPICAVGKAGENGYLLTSGNFTTTMQPNGTYMMGTGAYFWRPTISAIVAAGYVYSNALCQGGNFVGNSAVHECSDNLDNDGDGKIDYPADGDCDSTIDGTEQGTAPTPQCADGFDNDGNGYVDFPDDTGCESLGDDFEGGGTAFVQPICQNGVDDDLDQLVDYPEDPGCYSTTDESEENGPPGTPGQAPEGPGGGAAGCETSWNPLKWGAVFNCVVGWIVDKIIEFLKWIVDELWKAIRWLGEAIGALFGEFIPTSTPWSTMETKVSNKFPFSVAGELVAVGGAVTGAAGEGLAASDPCGPGLDMRGAVQAIPGWGVSEAQAVAYRVNLPTPAESGCTPMFANGPLAQLETRGTIESTATSVFGFRLLVKGILTLILVYAVVTSALRAFGGPETGIETTGLEDK